MDLKTKYSVGQEVFYISQKVSSGILKRSSNPIIIKSFIVESISYYIDHNESCIQYKGHDIPAFVEEYLFGSYKEAANYLIIRIKDLIYGDITDGISE